MPAFFPLLDVELELQSWLVGLLILRSDLSVPAVLAIWQLIIKNKDDIASLSLLSDDNFLRPINNEVTALIVHALFLLHDSKVVLIREMALRASNHDRDLAQLNLLLCEVVSLELVVLIPVRLLDMDVNLTVDLVSHVPDSSLMRKVRVLALHPWVNHHWLASSVNLTKDDLVLDIFLVLLVFLILDVRDVVVLLVHSDSVELVLLYAV